MGKRNVEIKAKPYKYSEPIKPLDKKFSEKAIIYNGIASLATEASKYLTASEKLKTYRERTKKKKHEAYKYVTEEWKKGLSKKGLKDQANPNAYLETARDEELQKKISEDYKERTGKELSKEDFDAILKQHTQDKGKYNPYTPDKVKEYIGHVRDNNINDYEAGTVTINSDGIEAGLNDFGLKDNLSSSDYKAILNNAVAGMANIGAQDRRNTNTDAFEKELSRLVKEKKLTQEQATKASNLHNKMRMEVLSQKDREKKRQDAETELHMGVNSRIEARTAEGLRSQYMKRFRLKIEEISNREGKAEIGYLRGAREKEDAILDNPEIINKNQSIVNMRRAAKQRIMELLPRTVTQKGQYKDDVSRTVRIDPSIETLGFVDKYRVKFQKSLDKGSKGGEFVEKRDFDQTDLNTQVRRSLDLNDENTNDFLELTSSGNDRFNNMLMDAMIMKQEGKDIKQKIDDLKKLDPERREVIESYLGEGTVVAPPTPVTPPKTEDKRGTVRKIIDALKGVFD